MQGTLISMETLENSKVYVNSNKPGYSFKHPIDYFGSFLKELDKIDGVDYHIQVDSKVENSNNDNSVNTSFGKVAIRARLPKEFDTNVELPIFNNLYKEMGIVYALDNQKPTIQMYRGNRVEVCSNQAIWGADNIMALSILDTGDFSSLNEKLKVYVDTTMEDNNKLMEIIYRLQSRKMDKEQLLSHIGYLVYQAKTTTNIGIQTVTGMVDLLVNDKSRYHFKEETDQWITYNGLTEVSKKLNIASEVSSVLGLQAIYN
jgi:hypothetical protein